MLAGARSSNTSTLTRMVCKFNILKLFLLMIVISHNPPGEWGGGGVKNQCFSIIDVKNLRKNPNEKTH